MRAMLRSTVALADVSFPSWCVLQTDRVEREFGEWEQDRARAWIVLENKYGWWSKYRRAKHEVGV